MRNISEQTGKSIPSIAIRFILDYIKNSVVLAGVKNPKQLLSNLKLWNGNYQMNKLINLLAISAIIGGYKMTSEQLAWKIRTPWNRNDPLITWFSYRINFISN